MRNAAKTPTAKRPMTIAEMSGIETSAQTVRGTARGAPRTLGLSPVEWVVEDGLLPYPEAVATMEKRAERIGVWVRRPGKPPLADGRAAEDKIAAIGIRVRRWVTFHGISLNVDPDLEHYSGIVPCGVSGYGVTSLVDLGIPVSLAEVDAALKATFEETFGATTPRA